MSAPRKFDIATEQKIVNAYLGVSEDPFSDAVPRTANSLAVEYGCGCWTILKILRRYGVTHRTHSEAYSVMTEEDRAKMTGPGQAAKRGKPMKKASKLLLAATVEAKGEMTILERQFRDWFITARPNAITVPQKAVGFYNVDIAIAESRIAVEIFGGYWHRTGSHAARYRKRIEHLVYSGWLPVIIWVVTRKPLTQGAVDYVVALHDLRCGDHTKSGQEHVIWGTGELIPVSERDPETGSRKKRFHGTDRPRCSDGRFRE